jgi:glycosyltransferase involved in cell wall biosynthesis
MNIYNQNPDLSVGFVSTYPPTECGLATFTFALVNAIASERGSKADLGVVSLADESVPANLPEVEFVHINGDRTSADRTIDVLNTFDVVVFEHEYGIYGGPDGVEILELVAGVTVPTVVNLHTIPTKPTSNQQMILESLVAETDRTIVMTQGAAERLNSQYDVNPDKVGVIPHGANPNLAGPRVSLGDRPIALTWGLIGPGKGLERAIKSFASLKDLDPLPRYIILGRTHPKVRAAHGDDYLEGLKGLVEELGLGEIVEFDGRYMDTDSLIETIRGVDMILVPYDSKEQATSGVLVEAIAAGKPVIATAFPHAIEILESGAGIVVPHDDPEAMTRALRRLLTDSSAANEMAHVAESIASTLFWPVVASSYETLFAELVADFSVQPVARVG